jgi:hypothetical protein
MPWSTQEDFTRYVPGHAIWNSAWADVIEHLETAKERIETAFRAAGHDLPIPLTSITREIKRIECILGGYDYIMGRGGEAVDGVDAQFIETWKTAEQWLRDVAKKVQQPLPVDPDTGEPEDADPDKAESGAGVYSDASRNWSALNR